MNLQNINDTELAKWQSEHEPNSAPHILAEREWKRRAELGGSKFWKHPLIITLLSGVILGLIGHHFENQRAETARLEQRVEKAQSLLEEYEKAVMDLRNACELWLLDRGERAVAAGETNWNQVEYLNTELRMHRKQVHERGSFVFGSLEIARTLGIPLAKDEITDMMWAIANLQSYSQNYSASNAGKMRSLLDDEFLLRHRKVLEGYRKLIESLDASIT